MRPRPRRYTRKIVELVADLRANSGDISHPLLTPHDPIKRSLLLVITSNRGLAGGYNGNVLRAAILRNQEIQTEGAEPVARGRGQARHQLLPVPKDGAGRDLHPVRGPSAVRTRSRCWRTGTSRCTFRERSTAWTWRYTQFVSSSRQIATVQTLLPITTAEIGQRRPVGPAVELRPPRKRRLPRRRGKRSLTSSFPTPRSILEEIVPVSFKVRLFKCFLDAAVSEQIARMVAMGGATKNADDLVKSLTRQYNRARQNQITRELADIVGAAGALE